MAHDTDTPAPQPEDAATLRLRLQERDAEVQMLKLLVAKLKLQLVRRNRMVFGSSSERFTDGAQSPQGTLLEGQPLYELPASKPASVPTSAPVSPAANSPAIDRSLPEHLPREAHVYRPDASTEHQDAAGQACGCGQCGGRLREIGRDVSEQLEYVPGRFKVVRHIRPRLACARCQSVFQAAAPSRPIARGLPGPALLAHVMVSKYCDHQPLYRQSGVFARDGVELAHSLLAKWVAKGDDLIDPLVAAVRRYVMACDKVHGDDTPVKVLAPGTGKTRTGRLWVYVRDDRPAGDPSPRAAWFAYSPDRGGEHPQAHLNGFRGPLQADAYAGWPRLYATGQVQEVACWAHARRPWWDLYLSGKRDPDGLAAQALGRIRALYEIEAEIRGQPPDVRRAQRQARAGPLLKAMRSWLEELLPRVSAKSDIAQGIGYSLGRWTALTRYVDDGRLEIGRVEMWRGGLRFRLSVSAPFVWRCPSTLALAPFPHPPRRTGRADRPHPALFRRIKPSRSSGRVQSAAGVSVPTFRRGTGRSTGGTPFPACRCAFAARSVDASQCRSPADGRCRRPVLG